MKIITKRYGKYYLLALKDNSGYYHNIIDDNLVSHKIDLAANLYYKSQVESWKKILRSEGHK